MKITEAIATQLLDVFQGGNWTDVDFKHTLQDVNWHEAVTVTKASPNTIAGILYHTGFYNWVIQQRLKGENPEINSSNGFDVPEVHNERDWKELKQNVLQSAQELAQMIDTYPEERLMLPIVEDASSVYKSIHGVIEHAHYHLGQIVILKNLIRKQKSNGSSL
jgi:hypothetical protein